MVRSINTLTVKQYSLFDKTGRFKYLMYLPVPFLFKKKLEKLIRYIADSLSAEGAVDKALNTEAHRLKSIYRIQHLTVLYQAIFNLMVNGASVSYYKKKEYKNLVKYLKAVKDKTNIEITCADDLQKLAKHIEFLNDKYLERFDKQEEKTGLTFTEIMIAIFGNNIQYQTTMADFFIMKKQAEELSKKLDG